MSREVSARAALHGMVYSLIAMGLLLISLFLWVLTMQHGQNPREAGSALLMLILLSLGSFIMGLLGTVFSSRGMDAGNTYNRGKAVTGLVCGIIALVIGTIFLLFFVFCALLLSPLLH